MLLASIMARSCLVAAVVSVARRSGVRPCIGLFELISPGFATIVTPIICITSNK